MTNDENEFMQDVINQASNKVELLQKTVIEKAVEIERLKAEYEKLQTNAEILARGVRDLNHENYELTEKIKQAKIEAVKEFAEKLWNKIKDNGIDYKIGLRALGEEIDELLKEYE